jgi:hypothetical protein
MLSERCTPPKTYLSQTSAKPTAVTFSLSRMLWQCHLGAWQQSLLHGPDEWHCIRKRQLVIYVMLCYQPICRIRSRMSPLY